MSIWVSHAPIGYDDYDDPDDPLDDGIRGGQVLTYANGFSNHYPSIDGQHELPADIDLAHIPAWCVPGHFEDYQEDRIGPWLRLGLHADAALSWFAKDADGRPQREPLNASVVLDEAAARRLAADLLAWADRPKIHPKETS